MVNAALDGLKLFTYIEQSELCKEHIEKFFIHGLDTVDSFAEGEYLYSLFNLTDGAGTLSPIVRICYDTGTSF